MISIYIIWSFVFEFDNKQKRFGYTCNKLDLKFIPFFIISVGLKRKVLMTYNAIIKCAGQIFIKCDYCQKGIDGICTSLIFFLSIMGNSTNIYFLTTYVYKCLLYAMRWYDG